MKLFLENIKTQTDLFQVPEMNYGQLQRWKNYQPLPYSIEMESSIFMDTINAFFAEFKTNEIEEDDHFDLPELINYKKAGRPSLVILFNKNRLLLQELILYHQYEILHLLIVNNKIGKVFYSINSIENISITTNSVSIEGICFKVDQGSLF